MAQGKGIAIGALVVLAAGGLASAQITEVRHCTGSDNNLDHPGWGSFATPQMRGPSGSHYPDGIGTIFAGPDRPNPRLISNLLCDQPTYVPDPGARSDFIWAWGQFMDHDISLTPEQLNPPEEAPIPIPVGDPVFDPERQGGKFMGFDRSAVFIQEDPELPREHINLCSTFIDGSGVYGIDDLRQILLRDFSNPGHMATSTSDYGPMLPYNSFNQPNAKDPFGAQTGQFLAGDPRCNEHAVLASLHTLFVREHNWWADRLSEEHPEWDGATLYEMARKLVGAEMEVITFRDYLPAIVGDRIPPYAGYDDTVNPSVRHTFATAAFRMGHTQVSGLIVRLDEDGSEIPEGSILVREAYFQPTVLTDEGGIEPILRGLASQVQEATDLKVKDDLRNFLFKDLPDGVPPVTLDLVSLNIHRGRDHGLPDYNTVRTDYGLPPRAGFYDVTTDPQRAEALEGVYGDINDIDPWIGMFAEDPLPGAVVGETAAAVIIDQFTSLRDGDRFWYANDQDLLAQPLLVAEIENTTLRDIVLRNTEIFAFPDDPFVACGLTGDVDKSKLVDSDDLNIVLSHFGQAVDPGTLGDVNGSGVVDSPDLNYVLSAFGLFCDD